jgi:CO/xanthine dehydrogenase Mo-binding subunit
VAKVIGRPVRAMLTREESFLTSAHRGRTRTRVQIGARRTGTLTALDVDVVYDGGTNAGTPASAAAARGLTGIGVRGGWYPFQILYSFPNQHYFGKEVWTNSFRAGPMRGVGRHFGLFALETAMEKAAVALGIDPLELRLANLNETGAIFDEITGQRPGLPFGRVGGQRESLLRAAELIGWHERRRERGEKEVRPGVFRGLGIVSTIDRGGGRQGGAPPDAAPPPSSAQLELGPDGVLEVFSGSTEVGSGQRTLMAMIAAQTSGIPLDQIVISPGVDTGVNTDTGPTNSSLQTNVAGWAVLEAASLLRDRLADLAAKHFSDEHGVDVSADEICVRDGEAHPESDPDLRARVADLARRAGEPLVTRSDRRRRLTAESVATGAHAVEAEVDTRTGGIRVIRYVAVHDVGRVLNRLALEQQVEGGVVMGLGSTLHEELILDQQTGLPLNPTILDYKPPSILEVPPFSIDFVEVPQDYGPYGAVAIGQASTPPVAPVIANAVHDAVGVWLGDMPFSPNRVLAALAARDGACAEDAASATGGPEEG